MLGINGISRIQYQDCFGARSTIQLQTHSARGRNGSRSSSVTASPLDAKCECVCGMFSELAKIDGTVEILGGRRRSERRN